MKILREGQNCKVRHRLDQKGGGYPKRGPGVDKYWGTEGDGKTMQTLRPVDDQAQGFPWGDSEKGKRRTGGGGGGSKHTWTWVQRRGTNMWKTTVFSQKKEVELAFMVSTKEKKKKEDGWQYLREGIVKGLVRITRKEKRGGGRGNLEGKMVFFSFTVKIGKTQEC